MVLRMSVHFRAVVAEVPRAVTTTEPLSLDSCHAAITDSRVVHDVVQVRCEVFKKVLEE